MTDTADTVRTGDKLLSITEAAEACSLSRQTIKRRIAEGTFPGAHREVMANQGGNERWVIPLADLQAAGLRPNAARRPTVADIDLTDAGNGDQYRGEIERLRREISQARQRAAVAEAVADERLRSLDHARLANQRQHEAMLLMLNGVSKTSAGSVTATGVS